VTDGVNGLVVDPDPPALAHAIRRLRDDTVWADQLGEAGRAMAAGVHVAARARRARCRHRRGDGVKIALVAPSPVPFVLGGAERLCHGLLEHINGSTAHDAEAHQAPGT
jgi:glycosyltransferase involved in cell wall biosynthesis